MSAIGPRALKVWGRPLLVALALGCAPVLAQDRDQNAPAEAGMPRNIVPPELMDQPAVEQGSAMNSDAPSDAKPDAPRATALPPPRPSIASTVTVGDLGTIEGPIAGTLNGTEGLGYDAWQGADRATIITLLQSAPAATTSAASRILLRKILLTTAPLPAGRADKSFNALRITKLLEGGLVNDAADLAQQVAAPMNPEILQTQATAFIYAGRDSDSCGDLTTRRLDSAERFWVELRAFCYAVGGDSALELTRSVISEQGISDPSFVMLLDGLASKMPMAPESIALPDALHILMLSRLNLPMNAEISTSLGLPESLMAAASMATPRALRLAAAEKALRAGVLPKELFGEVLDLASFAPQELNGAAALARAEPLMNALSRLRAAIKVSPRPDERADLIHTAFQIADRENLLRQVAGLFADDAAGIVPASDWGNWSELMMRGLLLADRQEAARRWFIILRPNDPGAGETVSQLGLALGLAAPLQADSLTNLAFIRELALAANPPPPAPPPPPMIERDPSAPADQPPPDPPPPPPPPPPQIKPPQAVISRATLMVGLYEATGRPLPAEAQTSVQPLVMQPSPGRRPPPALMERIDKAALSGARGEVALSVMIALGPQGARDLAPDIVVRLVRALQTAGIRDAAHELANEAVLLRPVASLISGG